MATIHPDDSPAGDEVLALYEAVGWTAYTRDPDALMRAIEGSTWVAAARRGGRSTARLRAAELGWLAEDPLARGSGTVEEPGSSRNRLRPPVDRALRASQLVQRTVEATWRRALGEH